MPRDQMTTSGAASWSGAIVLVARDVEVAATMAASMFASTHISFSFIASRHANVLLSSILAVNGLLPMRLVHSGTLLLMISGPLGRRYAHGVDSSQDQGKPLSSIPTYTWRYIACFHRDLR